MSRRTRAPRLNERLEIIQRSLDIGTSGPAAPSFRPGRTPGRRRRRGPIAARRRFRDGCRPAGPPGAWPIRPRRPPGLPAPEARHGSRTLPRRYARHGHRTFGPSGSQRMSAEHASIDLAPLDARYEIVGELRGGGPHPYSTYFGRRRDDASDVIITVANATEGDNNAL